MARTRRVLRAIGGLLTLLSLGACADYLRHSDTITDAAGDAMAHNNAVHITDPWPRAAANTRIPGDGRRVERVIQQYQTGGNGGLPAPAPIAIPLVPTGAPGDK